MSAVVCPGSSENLVAFREVIEASLASSSVCSDLDPSLHAPEESTASADIPISVTAAMAMSTRDWPASARRLNRP